MHESVSGILENTKNFVEYICRMKNVLYHMNIKHLLFSYILMVKVKWNPNTRALIKDDILIANACKRLLATFLFCSKV